MACEFEYPYFSINFCIAVVGLIKLLNTAFNWVETSAVFPVTPVNVAMLPNNSSNDIFNVEDNGNKAFILLAISGNVVTPNLAV